MFLPVIAHADEKYEFHCVMASENVNCQSGFMENGQRSWEGGLVINIQISTFLTLSRGKLKQIFCCSSSIYVRKQPFKTVQTRLNKNGAGKKTQTEEAVIRDHILGLRKLGSKPLFDFLSSLIPKARVSKEANCQSEICNLLFTTNKTCERGCRAILQTFSLCLWLRVLLF